MFAGLAAKLGVYAIAAVAVMVAIGGAGTWGYLHGKKVTTAEYEEQSLKNVQEAREDEAKLWKVKVAAEKVLRDQAEKGRQNAANDITKIKAELARTRVAPIPRSLARMLDEPADGESGGADPAASVRGVGAVAGDTARGPAGDYISASDFYAAIRQNASRYQENVRKLISCTAAYNGIRETLLGSQ